MKAGPELAWRQLVKQKGHFSAALAGVAFAVTLMLGQIGLRDSLLSTGIRLYEHLRADIVMTSWEYQFQQGAPVIPNRRFAETMAVSGVASCAPLQIGWLSLENPDDHEEHQIVMLGFNPHDDLWDFTGQQVNFAALTEPDTLIFDADSRSMYGPLPELFKAGGRVPVNASRHRGYVVGLLELGPGFGNDGFVFTSDTSFKLWSEGVASSLPNVGAIRLNPGADPQKVLQDLRVSMPPDVRFSDFHTFLVNEQAHWLKTSPIGFVFTAGLVLGIVVGSVVVYQILYSDVTNHLAEYATMKAMGYPDGKLFRLVVLQAVFMSILGFIPGALMAKAIFVVTHNVTLLPLELSVERLSEVYALTFFMCVGSGALAMLALKAADPAEIF